MDNPGQALSLPGYVSLNSSPELVRPETEKKERMIIFGIDPGSSKLGYGVVDLSGGSLSLVDQGVIRAGTRLPFNRRILQIHDGLRESIRRHSPRIVAIEEVFYGRNARTALKIGECRGIALLVAARAGAEIAEYATRDVKKAVVGNGAARKEQVKWMIARQFDLMPETLAEDAADALALCVTHFQRMKANAMCR